jgi:histidinol dehydrogenase
LGAIEAEVGKQCNALPRGEFASKALSHSFTVLAKDMIEVILDQWLPATSYT